ncbi:flavin reductase family protein [Rhizobium sp. FY34]|uniref:flavin reductase family protein n=1 Tax=Rhizobium sp. FY34 TaxID=2562309 RepID=UPI0010C00587|nr:flavin reductase family protein [Rhizobium sp. FY34]
MDDLIQSFKATMARYPAGVVVVTTTDEEGRAYGFTATSFSSLSLKPPSIIVCLANTAYCYNAFVNSRHFAVHFIDAEDSALAMGFASKGIDKFSGVKVDLSAEGVPLLKDSVAVLECGAGGHFVSGDHAILIGNVLRTKVSDDRDVLVHYRRQFGKVSMPAAI